VQICRHSPSSRFITLFYAVFNPSTGSLTYVNAGQNPPLIRRRNGRYERLGGTGVALGMFDHSVFGAVETMLDEGETLVLYSDGITEAEDPSGQPFEESGLELVVERYANAGPGDICAQAVKAVEAHAKDSRFTDDLTILVLKRGQSSL
jgi:sigma-B regulation protein RsbU (phosphoserine phosphatase)